MPKPLPAGGRGTPGGLLLLHGRQQQHRRAASTQRLLLAQEQESIHRTWNAVIHFSARHLFCPAHAHTQAQSAITAAASTYKPIAAAATANRIRGSGSVGGGHFHLSRHTTTATRCMTGLPLPGSNLPVSSRGAASFILRKLSTAVAIESYHDPSPYSSGDDRQRSPLETRFRREPVAATMPRRSAGSGSVTPGGGEALSHAADRSTSVSPRQGGKNESTPPAEYSPKRTRAKASSSWRFPTKGFGSQFSNSDDNDPLGPVQSWTSTANALSELYKSLHHLVSFSKSSTAGSSTETILHSALVNYNYLSRLQSMYDTILIPRRHTRTLFLLQGREPKTRDNLQQLLRITTDLIWLNEKERQKKRRSASSLASSAAVVPLVVSATKNDDDASPRVHNPADGYHGLRVSEYTVLMNWIGSVTSTLATHPSPAGKSVTNRSSTPSTATATARSTTATSSYQHPIALSGPVDQAWAIWNDFLLTGMKPDVVLYTMLMDTLLKAKEFERADQIWDHMQIQGSTSDVTKSSTSAKGSSGNRIVPSSYSGKYSKAASSSADVVVPNLQTLSVMLQSHIQESDIDGVARTYRQLHHTTLHRERQRPINTVLVNQILKVLVDLGETKAAKEIFSEMQVDCGDIGAEAPGFGSGNEENYTKNINSGSTTASAPAVFSMPIHHQTSRRRASWKRDNRKRPCTSSSLANSPSDTSTGGLSIRPNEATYKLMLQVARREMDTDLEGQVLKELRCLSLSSYSSDPSR
ncbi:hypothetical protein BGZ96_007491 [Linnemannia gamsii]|uniref:Pentatricopeptide repeat protein n=1 Tax=Linnemannia gamsii TaxID=64522 RepID=A0ABQ7K0A1_9FUNG|nr:hypothetical protein BGZ96_007491 [Linnemannia gamsii]